jgi:hypothetical protein
MELFQVLLLCALASSAVAMTAARAAWPKLRALEARGLVTTPVPDLIQGRVRPLRTTILVWATSVPADRKSLRRLLVICRSAQLAVLCCLIGAAVAMTNAEPPASGPWKDDPPLSPDSRSLGEPAS